MAWITVEMMEECNSNTIIIIFCKLSLATLFGIFLLYLPYCHTFSHYYPISTYKTVLSFFNLALCHILVLRMCLQPKVNIGNNTTCLLVSFDCAPSNNLGSIQISYYSFLAFTNPSDSHHSHISLEVPILMHEKSFSHPQLTPPMVSDIFEASLTAGINCLFIHL